MSVDVFRDCKEALRGRVPEVLLHYGTEIRRNRCRCPIHGGRDFNAAVTAHGITCFSKCGRSYDIIELVQHFTGKSALDAAKELDAMFSLHLPFDNGSLSASEKAQFAAEKQRRQQERKSIARTEVDLCDNTVAELSYRYSRVMPYVAKNEAGIVYTPEQFAFACLPTDKENAAEMADWWMDFRSLFIKKEPSGSTLG